MRCFPAQVPVLAPLVPELPSLLSCDLQAVLNNIDLTKFETFRTPENAHLFDEAVDLFQEVNGTSSVVFLSPGGFFISAVLSMDAQCMNTCKL